jgi:hypothetical protein
MSQTAFDASGFVRFDLARGRIRSAADEDLALVPLRLLGLLPPGDGLVAAGREWGRIHGERLARAGREAPIETLADALGGALAVAGLGRLALETRGDALLFRVAPAGDTLPDESAAGRDLLVGFIAGFLTALEPAGFEVVELCRDSGSRLFWAGNPAAAGRVRAWIAGGVEPLQALDRLAQGGAR